MTGTDPAARPAQGASGSERLRDADQVGRIGRPDGRASCPPVRALSRSARPRRRPASRRTATRRDRRRAASSTPPDRRAPRRHPPARRRSPRRVASNSANVMLAAPSVSLGDGKLGAEFAVGIEQRRGPMPRTGAERWHRDRAPRASRRSLRRRRHPRRRSGRPSGSGERRRVAAGARGRGGTGRRTPCPAAPHSSSVGTSPQVAQTGGDRVERRSRSDARGRAGCRPRTRRSPSADRL